MLRIFTICLAFAALTLTACSESAEEKIQGTWKLDVEEMRKLDSYKNAAPAIQENMETAFKMMDIKMTFDDGKMSGSIGGGLNAKKNGTYTVKSEDGDKIVLDTVEDNGTKSEITIWIDGDIMTVGEGDEQMKLRRE